MSLDKQLFYVNFSSNSNYRAVNSAFGRSCTVYEREYNYNICTQPMKKNLTNIPVSQFLIGFGIFLSLIIYPIIFVSQNQFFYRYHLSNNPEIHPAEIATYQQISKDITGFLITGQGLPVSLMSQRAVVHMIDVRDIYQRGMLLPLIFIAFGGLLFVLENKKISSKLILVPPITVLVLYSILIIGGEKLFRFLFLNFHFLFYTNDLWMLDPDDLLIRLYPENFFSRLFMVSGLITVVISLVIILFTIIFKKYANSFSNR